ncbi:MAG TPA: hypothetical protein VMB46_02400 [Methanomassiliicoccales archaeon]|nr:hypothetical protein [Methanomassiliicoccales archaeon]
MDRDIAGIYDLIAAESKFASGERDKLLGAFTLLIATVLGLLWLSFLDLSLGNLWLWLLVPSIVIGLVGIVVYWRGNDTSRDAMRFVQSNGCYYGQERK